MRQAENKIRIEGYLAETNLQYGSFEREGKNVDSIGGTVKILVEQEINGVEKTLEIPIYMFAAKYTKKNQLNPAYESAERVMKEFISIAAAGSKEQADRVRITNGTIRMNEFYGQDGRLVSQPRIYASFVQKAIGDFKPEASFVLEFAISSIKKVVDDQGIEVEPATLEVTAIVPQFTPPNETAPRIDIVKLHATSPNVISAIENYWEEDGTYRANGRLNFSSTTQEIVQEVDFGEAVKSYRTVNINEFIITGGSQVALDADQSFSIEELQAGIAARKVRIEESKTKAGGRKAPAQNTTKGALDLGF